MPPVMERIRLSVSSWRVIRRRPAPEGRAQRDLTGSRGSPRQEEIRDVGGSEEQQQSDQQQEKEEESKEEKSAEQAEAKEDPSHRLFAASSVNAEKYKKW